MFVGSKLYSQLQEQRVKSLSAKKTHRLSFTAAAFLHEIIGQNFYVSFTLEDLHAHLSQMYKITPDELQGYLSWLVNNHYLFRCPYLDLETNQRFILYFVRNPNRSRVVRNGSLEIIHLYKLIEQSVNIRCHFLMANFTDNDLSHHFGTGFWHSEETLLAILDELCEAGYITRLNIKQLEPWEDIQSIYVKEKQQCQNSFSFNDASSIYTETVDEKNHYIYALLDW